MVIINIDTSKDSPDDLRKTIKYLQELIGEQAAVSTSSPAPVAVPAVQPPQEFAGLETFGNDLSSPPVASEAISKAAEERKPSRTPEAERLLQEAEEVEVIDESQGAFIEIVDLDET